MRGGIKEKKKIKNADQALLAAIWEMYGGPSEVSIKLSHYLKQKFTRQDPINWRIRGQIPVKYVKRVAEALNINPIGLNYITLFNLGVDIPSWEDVVKSYGLNKNIVQYILTLKAPGKKR